MKKQTSKKEKTNISSNDRMEMMLEDMQDQIKVIAEGVVTVNDKVDRLEGKVDKLEGKVDRLEGKVDKLEGKVDKLDADLSSFKSETEANFKLAFSHMSLLEDEIVSLRKEFEEMKDKDYVTREEFQALNKKLTSLEIKFEKIMTANKKVKQSVR
ncbi:MAG TPA: hypothetical protein ENJ49_00830 [Candidatus Moranbacteria bacterium]|nr:hypothetical protein [Candidatus Moranbacteria bacterium]